jgi:hypothetical protein
MIRLIALIYILKLNGNKQYCLSLKLHVLQYLAQQSCKRMKKLHFCIISKYIAHTRGRYG